MLVSLPTTLQSRTSGLLLCLQRLYTVFFYRDISLTYCFNQLLTVYIYTPLLIQGTAHAQVCLFLMCFRSQASTRLLIKLLVEYSSNKLLGCSHTF